MRRLALLTPLLLACHASPLSFWRQIEGTAASLHGVLQGWAQMSDQSFGPALAVPQILDYVKQAVFPKPDPSTSWTYPEAQFIEQDGIVYEAVWYSEFPDHRLRMKSPKLCDDVVQYSGYLDVKGGAHSLFFWFFESRSDPSNDPLMLWLNGGPGCSSSTGLLFELGPCAIADDGRNTTHNPHSWTSNANVIFLDQPVAVGYSYSHDGSSVNTTPVAAEDVWAFLQLFLVRHPKYAHAPFHLAAESYGGHYAPHIASVIHKKNRQLALISAPSQPKINLASVIIGNGLTDPYAQFGSIPDYACKGPYPIFEEDSFQCSALYTKSSTCERLIRSCYNFNSKWTCLPAALYCWTQMYGSFQNLGLNPYDVRKKCDRVADGPLCYKPLQWIETYMNQPDIKAELGASRDVEFQSCNEEVTRAFLGQGDSMHNSAVLLPELLSDGIRLLAYSGNADFMCNFMGIEAWMERLESPFQADFTAAKSVNWTMGDKSVGIVRSAGGAAHSAGNYTFVQMFDSGHMVPHDQPEAALQMITRWVSGKAISQ